MSSDKKHPRGLLTVDDAAAFFGKSRATIHRWVDQGILRPQERLPRVGKRQGAMFFSQEYLDRKLAEWTTDSGEPE